MLSLFISVLTFKIAFTSSAHILLFNFNITTFIWPNTHSISALECGIGQWRTQKIFMGAFHSVAHGGHLYLVCAVYDDMI